MVKTRSSIKKSGAIIPKKSRSCGYPLLALPRAIEAAKMMHDGFGEGPHSRENAARGLGYSSFSGAASSKIGSLVHFGLLARTAGMYSVTALAREVFLYPNEASGEAIAKAAAKPVLYGKLLARFLDKPLPEKLEAILATDYGVTAKAAPIAAQNFIETMEFAGLVREGMLVYPERDSEAASPGEKNVAPKEKESSGVAGSAIKIKLSSGIEISFPKELAYRLSMGEFAAQIKGLDKTGEM